MLMKRPRLQIKMGTAPIPYSLLQYTTNHFGDSPPPPTPTPPPHCVLRYHKGFRLVGAKKVAEILALIPSQPALSMNSYAWPWANHGTECYENLVTHQVIHTDHLDLTAYSS